MNTGEDARLKHWLVPAFFLLISFASPRGLAEEPRPTYPLMIILNTGETVKFLTLAPAGQEYHVPASLPLKDSRGRAYGLDWLDLQLNYNYTTTASPLFSTDASAARFDPTRQDSMTEVETYGKSVVELPKRVLIPTRALTPVSALGTVRTTQATPVFDASIRPLNDRERAIDPVHPAGNPSLFRIGTPSCPECEATIEGPLAKLAQDMNQVVGKIEQRRWNNFNYGMSALQSRIAGRVRSTCGIDFGSFTDRIARVGRPDVPPALLLSIMTTESGGNCGGSNRPNGASFASTGLFQVNACLPEFPGCAAAPKLPVACTPAQQSEIRTSSPETLAAKIPPCMNNPYVNLDAAVQIFRDKRTVIKTLVKRQATSSGAAPGGAAIRALHEALQHPDAPESRKFAGVLDRLAVAAYNGGEGFVQKALQAMTDFNQKNQSSYGAEDWKAFRYFYLRNLTRPLQKEEQYFGGAAGGGRSEGNTVINESYVETILGMTPGDPNSLLYQWEKKLGSPGP